MNFWGYDSIYVISKKMSRFIITGVCSNLHVLDGATECVRNGSLVNRLFAQTKVSQLHMT